MVEGTMNNSVQPIFILPEGTQRTSGRNAQRNNILAAKLVAETVRTTLGPKGMDKMLVDSLGNVTVTNDGVTILEEMHIEHPAAKMIVEVAKTQENEVGDGTTTAVILAGELLINAEKLLDQKIHPTVIINGYRIAAAKALATLQTITQPLTLADTKTLHSIAATAMTGKGAEAAKDHLAKLAVEAVTHISTTNQGKTLVAIDNIKIEKSVGQSIDESELIVGIVLDKERVHPSMPLDVPNAKILLLDASLEIKDMETDAKISITDPKQMQAFFDMEESMIKTMTDRIVAAGATAVFCQKGIDDLAAYYLAKANILAVRRVKKSDMEKLAQATGARMLSDNKDITTKALGSAGRVIERKVGDQNMLFVEDCAQAKAVTILVRGGTEHVADEVRRAMTDAVGDLRASIESGKVVAGAGACEIELARQLQQFANTLSGRERLAVQAFAESLEVIPRTLAENAGLDPIDVVADLRAAHEKNPVAGIDVFSGKVMDAWKTGVIEPLRIKTQAITAASEVAIMILRIDDVIAAGEKTGTQEPPGYD
jgi:archaeal chaperonin